jgi:hypothetical protein
MRGREALRSGQCGCLPYNKHGLMILGNPTVSYNNADNDSDTDDDAVPPAKKHKALGTSLRHQTPPPDLECPVFKRPIFRPPPAWVPKYNAGEAGGSQGRCGLSVSAERRQWADMLQIIYSWSRTTTSIPATTIPPRIVIRAEVRLVLRRFLWRARRLGEIPRAFLDDSTLTDHVCSEASPSTTRRLM